jgi:NADH-quinone oxidoreductase subunit N
MLPNVNWAIIAPQIIVVITAIVVLLLGVFGRPADDGRNGEGKGYLAYLSLAGVIIAGVTAFYIWDGSEPSVQGMVTADSMASFLNLVFLIVAGLSILVSVDYAARRGLGGGEYYALLLFSTAGMMFLGAATNLIVVFVALEILSIPLYVLSGFNQKDARSGESALKYFLLGAFSSGFLLYGIALLYGGTGSMSLATIAAVLKSGGGPLSPYVWLGMGLVIVGFGFKVALVPFHMWTPDVYQGAPTSVTAFMSVGAKAAGFAALIRILAGALTTRASEWAAILAVLAILTMTLGNVAAIAQTNLKRMLAYSSIAHAGYILVGLVSGTIAGLQAMLFYLAAYAFMNIGAFAVVSYLSGKGEQYQNVEDFAGLAQKQPLTAAMLSIFLLSLIGVPLTGGFFGKFYIFKAALESHLVWLTVLGLLNSAVAAYYYLRILVMMYMREPSEAATHAEALSPTLGAAFILPAAGTLFLGIFPNWVLDFAVRSSNLLK